MGIIKWLAIGGIAVLIRYAKGLKKAEEKITVVASGKVKNLTFSGVTLILRYNIRNPTSTGIKMSPPLIRLMLNNKEVASSKMSDIDIPEQSRDSKGNIMIPSNGETGNIETEVTIPFMSMASAIPDIAKRFWESDPKKKKKIEFNLQVLSTVYTYVGSFPYESQTLFKL